MKKKELIIVPEEAIPLSRQQQKFNSLIKKIKTLRDELVKKDLQLNSALDYYAKKLYPLEKTATELRVTLIKLLYQHYSKSGLSRKDNETLRFIISDKLHELLLIENSIPEELQHIFSKTEGQSVGEMNRERMEDIFSELRERMEYMGIETDPEENAGTLTDEELFSKLHEFQFRIIEGDESGQSAKATRKKSKKQLEKETKEKGKEEARKKTVSSIYRSLAKALHPDLEQDLELKKEKEKQMQLLTSAYEKGDLHTLLKLELEWISKEEANIEKLTNDKLEIYNNLLDEQVRDLKVEIYRLQYTSRFAALKQYVTSAGTVNIKRAELDLSKQLKALKETVQYLQSDNAGSVIKSMIKTTKKINEGYF